MIIESISLNQFDVDYDPPKITFPKFYFERKDLPAQIFAKNGSGKSSLVLSLAGAIPSEIKANINLDFKCSIGERILDLPEIRKYLRIIPQKWKHGILGFLPQEEINLSNPNETEWKRYLVDYFEISKLNKIPSAFLSDGEKKRLMICNALVANPLLVVSDEWTAHLDQIWIGKIDKVLTEFVQNGGFHLEFHSNFQNEENRFVETNNISNHIKYPTFLSKFFWNPCPLNVRTKVKFTSSKGKSNIEIGAKNGDLLLIQGDNGSGKTTLMKNLWKKAYFNKFIRFHSIPKTLFIPTDPLYHIVGPTLGDEIERVFSKNFDSETENFFKDLLNKNLNTDVFAFSFGERKTLAILLGLLSDYGLIMIDEPFAGLDDKKKKVVKNFIKYTIEQGKIVFISDQIENVEFYTKKIRL